MWNIVDIRIIKTHSALILNVLLSAVARFIFYISFVLFILSIHTLLFNVNLRKRCFS